jgi:hypothetical protein
VLFLAANPRATSRLDIDHEVRRVEQQIRASPNGASLQLISRWAVQPGDLQQALLEVEPSVVHFSGHGTTSERLLLDDGEGNTAPVSNEALAQLFSILKGRIRVVVLNACHSRPQAEAIIEHVDCAIGMARAIGDEAATEFVVAFYRAIGYRRSVAEAFALGVNALKLKGIPEANTPQLLVRAGVDAAKVFLVPAPLPPPSPPWPAPPPERWPLPAILLSVFVLACIGVLASAILRAPAPLPDRSAAPITPAASGARQ